MGANPNVSCKEIGMPTNSLNVEGSPDIQKIRYPYIENSSDNTWKHNLKDTTFTPSSRTSDVGDIPSTFGIEKHIPGVYTENDILSLDIKNQTSLEDLKQRFGLDINKNRKGFWNDESRQPEAARSRNGSEETLSKIHNTYLYSGISRNQLPTELWDQAFPSSQSKEIDRAPLVTSANIRSD